MQASAGQNYSGYKDRDMSEILEQARRTNDRGLDGVDDYGCERRTRLRSLAGAPPGSLPRKVLAGSSDSPLDSAGRYYRWPR